MDRLLERNEHGGIDRICHYQNKDNGKHCEEGCGWCTSRAKCNANIFEKLVQYEEIGFEPFVLKSIVESITHMVTEVCPHCESENTLIWDVATMGYKAHCPVCGEEMMLCDECIHAEDGKNENCNHCDWHLSDGGESRCFRCPQE